jgi:hypothetical protein
MSDSHPVRCVDCGYLSLRARWQGDWRTHQGYFEAERWHRDNPRDSYRFVPGESNAQNAGEFACYRAAADLPAEVGQTVGSEGIDRDQATARVITRDRNCSKWTEYEPGLGPPETLREYRIRASELERQAFEERLRAFERRFNKRLSRTAILFALVIGIVQLWVSGMSMVPESFGNWFGRWVVGITNAIAHWFGR